MSDKLPFIKNLEKLKKLKKLEPIVLHLVSKALGFNFQWSASGVIMPVTSLNS